MDWEEYKQKLINKHGTHFLSTFNGVDYRIPIDEIVKFSKFVEEVWKPELEKGLVTDHGTKRIPTNIRALSWTTFLKEQYKKWDNYLVKSEID